MPTSLEWHDVALRLALTLLAGFIFGLNRYERGRTAGLRTLLLVCLAASVAMILSNLFLATSGKSSGDFATLDPMRLPLGILTGMGFIGGGAILRRGDMITGVTTAATLWFVTVVGLCFGGGQLILGAVATALGVIVLAGLNWFEMRLHQDRQATLFLRALPEGPTHEEIRQMLLTAGFWIITWEVAYEPGEGGNKLTVLQGEVGWRGRHTAFRPPEFINGLARRAGVLEVRWKA